MTSISALELFQETYKVLSDRHLEKEFTFSPAAETSITLGYSPITTNLK
ncbi:MAG: hypothetical protein ABIH82_01140 [Candidatus Woesearchaeota archaeon]